MDKLIKSAVRKTIGIFINFKEADKGSYAQFKVSKQYKPKDSDEWKDTNIYFLDELLALRSTIDRAISYAETQLAPARDIRSNQSPSAQVSLNTSVQGPEFDDDDIPF